MRRVLVFALASLVLVPGLVRGAEILEYQARLDVELDGSGHASTTIVVSGDPSETLEIPLVLGAWTNLRVAEAPEGLGHEPPRDKAVTFRITLPAEKTERSRLTFTFDVPEAFAKPENPANGGRSTIPKESRTLKCAFVNTQEAFIKDFGMLVTLPAGYRFQAIREQLPKPRKTEVEPRVRLGEAGGRQNAFLQLSNLKQGDSTSMHLEALPSQRSPLWLLAGIVISALYLVLFRDLVARRSPSTTPQ